MSKENKVFSQHAVPYTDANSIGFIHSNLFQKLEFPQEYPAYIQVHMEHPAMNVPLHWHPAPELIYSRNKEITVIIDTKRVVVRPGEFVLISSYALHAVEPKQDNIHQDVLSISFQSGYLKRIMPDICKYVISRDAPGVTDEIHDKFADLCEQLRKQVEKQSEYFETNRLLYAMLQMMYKDFLVGQQDNDPKEMKMKNTVVEILAYIERNYRNPLTTKAVADHFGYTREYFCRMYKSYSGQTFKEYLTEIRLREAVQELVVSDQSIGFIAMNHGFPDEKSFFNAFKKTYQMTPAQFRKQWTEEMALHEEMITV